MAMATAASSLAGMLKGLSISASSASSFLAGDSKLKVSTPVSSGTNVIRLLTIEAAHKKGSGSTKNGRDSKPKMLGVKIYGDQKAQPGAIIIRQRGTKVWRIARVLSVFCVETCFL